MVSKIVYEHGNPFFEIDGERFVPAAYRTYRFYPANIRHIYRCGIRLFQMIVSGGINSIKTAYSWYGECWKGHGQYDFTAFDRQMQDYMREAPEGYFYVQVTLDNPSWWQEENPEDPSSFSQLGQAVFCDRWKREAAEYLKAFLTYAEEKYGDRIFSYSFTAGWCTEFFCEEKGKANAVKKEKWREFLGDPNAEVPEDFCIDDTAFRRAGSLEYKYLEWSCNAVADTINFFGAEAQKVIKHQKILGLFLGYIDMSCPTQNTWLTNAYEKCWENPDFDMVYSPAAYKENRFLNYVSSFQQAVDSLAVHKKLYLHEMDHRTELAKYAREHGAHMWDCYDTQRESFQVLRRELALTMEHHATYWWFDFMGGYYNTPEYEVELRHQLDIFKRLSYIERKNVSEVAVFVDPMSFLSYQENSDIYTETVRMSLNELRRCGTPYDVFNLNDLPLLDKNKYKLYIFLNAVHPKPEIAEYIENELKDKYKFFVGAPGYGFGETLSTENITRLTGMHTEAFSTDRLVPAFYKGKEFGFKNGNYIYTREYVSRGGYITPLFEITDPTAETLARYDNGKVACAYKNQTFYCATGNIPYTLFTDAAERAGAHIYFKDGHGLSVTSSFLAINTIGNGTCTVTMPEDCMLIDLYDEGNFYRTDENRRFTFTSEVNDSKLFLIRKR